MAKESATKKIRKTVITGEVYERLTVGKISKISGYSRFYEFHCECGRVKVIREDSVRLGNTKSCGCLRKERASKLQTTKHNLFSRKARSIFKDMHSRCESPRCASYKHYGALGVTVCNRWSGKDGFINFITDMGLPQDKDTIERISVKGNYDPTNCKWEKSLSIQGYNKRLSGRNTSGKTGVRKNYGAWQAYIFKNGIFHSLGRWATFEKAVLARRKGELNYYGFYQEDTTIGLSNAT